MDVKFRNTKGEYCINSDYINNEENCLCCSGYGWEMSLVNFAITPIMKWKRKQLRIMVDIFSS